MSERIPTNKPADFLPEKDRPRHSDGRQKQASQKVRKTTSWTLDFTIKEPSEPLPTIPLGDEKKVMEYAVQRANPGFRDIKLVPSPSPFDIKVDRPRWVVVELDAKIANWQFAKDERRRHHQGRVRPQLLSATCL
ncbi:hypothetical protein ACRAWD_10375 [Caulobacter segnis]